MKKFGFLIAGLALVAFTAGSAWAGNNQIPSSKTTVLAGKLAIVEQLSDPADGGDTSDFTPQVVLSTKLKTPNQKHIIIGVSMTCGNFLQTEVKSKGGNKDTSSANASVRVSVWVDDVAAIPGNSAFEGDNGIVFCRRSQTLEATFQGIIEGTGGFKSFAECEVPTVGGLTFEEWVAAGEDDGTQATFDGLVDGFIINDACLTPEIVNLITESMQANHYNFVAPVSGAGVHDIKVKAYVDTGAFAQEGSARARALIGWGTVVAEEVRLIKGATITCDQTDSNPDTNCF